MDDEYRGTLTKSFVADVPDSKPAIIYAPTGEQLTRKELRDGAQKLAHGLRHKLGLKPGDVSTAESFCGATGHLTSCTLRTGLLPDLTEYPVLYNDCACRVSLRSL